MDGARLGNACQELGLSLRGLACLLSRVRKALNRCRTAATRDLGVNSLSLGLTKAGAMDAEVCVLFLPDGTTQQARDALQLEMQVRLCRLGMRTRFAMWRR